MPSEPSQTVPKSIQLVRAGPSSDFHDLEVGFRSHTPGLKTAPGPKNELRRLTSLRTVISSGEFWESLPLMSKIFLLASCTDALLVIAFSIQQMASVRTYAQHMAFASACLYSTAWLNLIVVASAEHTGRASPYQPCHAGYLHLLPMVCVGCYHL